MKPTCDLQAISADLTLHVKATPPFGVIGSAQAGHVHNTLVVDVHITGCRVGKTEETINSRMDAVVTTLINIVTTGIFGFFCSNLSHCAV